MRRVICILRKQSEFMINLLMNKQMMSIGRASNMCWIIFGAVGVDNEKYSLHMQCPWRIIDTKNHTVVIASGDIYEPNSSIAIGDNEFDWDIRGNNLFDEKINCFFESRPDFVVKESIVSQNNDLKIVFSNEYILECFVDVSTDIECWRFFQQGSGEHYVVGGKTIGLE